MNKTYLLTGGNEGDRYLNMQLARANIELICGRILLFSSIYETAPWGKSDPNTIGSIPASATTRSTFSSGYGAITKCSRKICEGRRSRRPVSDHFALRPMRNAWSILRKVYGSQTVPHSDRQTLMFGNWPKKFCKRGTRPPSPRSRPISRKRPFSSDLPGSGSAA